jgi:hypothetical protein
MIEKVIDLFNKSGKEKIVFEPGIKIKLTPHSPVTWIDKMYKIGSSYMITVSTLNDSMNVNLNSADPVFLQSLSIRLYSLYGKENVVNK